MPPEVAGNFLACREFLNTHFKKADGTNEQPHKMDLFVSIAEKMSTAQFKKTTWDFEIADGKAINTYKEIRMKREKKLENPIITKKLSTTMTINI